MLTADRWRYILEQLDVKGSVLVSDLVESLEVSESTIRRDLSQLESKKLLVRVHGGAESYFETASEPKFQDKIIKHTQAKQQIASYATDLINDFEAIYIDAGTTTLAMVPYLKKKKGLKIITNGIQQAHELGALDFELVILGGILKSGTQAVIGTQALQQLSQYHFDKAFVGINGISLNGGLTTPDIQEAVIKQTAIHQSRQPYILADESKFNKTSFVKVEEIDRVTIITDSLSPEIRKQYQDKVNIKEAST